MTVTLTEETGYPFRDRVRITVGAPSPTRFPLHLRVPAWASGATVHVNDAEPEPAAPGTVHVLDRTWNPGDAVTLRLPMAVRLERRPRGAVAVHRGPLVFSLQIGEAFTHLRGEKPHADWEVSPTTAWNYGLALGRRTPEEAFAVRESPVGPVPFAPDAAPVTLSAPARRLPQWTLQDNVGGPVPDSPAPTDAPVEQVTLIPYGSAHLRITEFPTVAP